MIDKKRGRPATGRRRDKQMSLQVTEAERDEIKKAAKDSGKTLADMVLDLIRHQAK